MLEIQIILQKYYNYRWDEWLLLNEKVILIVSLDENQ